MMNKPTMRTQPTAAEILTGPRPGETLRRAREAKNLTMEDIWSQTRLSPRIIQAIEQDAYDQLPSPSYVRGYIRNYARVIGIDGESLVQEYNQVVKQPVADLHDFLSRPRGEMNAGSFLVKAVSWGLAALMLGLVYVWGQNHYFTGNGPADPNEILSGSEVPGAAETPAQAVPGTGPTVATNPHAAAPAPAASTPAPATTPAAGPATATNPPASPTPAAPTAVTPATTAPTTAPAQPFAPPAPGSVAAAPGSLPPVPGPATGVANSPHQVVLNIEKETWIEVRDKSGSRLYYKTANPGETINLAGAPPMKVIIGRYPGVNLSYDGRPVDFARFVRGGTAKFNLAEDGSTH